MKFITLIALSLLTTAGFSQKIEVGQSDVPPMVGVNVFVLAIDIDFDKKYLLDMGDGQQFILENHETIEGRSKHVAYKYSEPKSYILKLQEIDNSGVSKIIDMQNLKIKAKPTKITLTNVVLKGYSPVKEGDLPWDNYWGGTYPDVFLNVTDGAANTLATNINDYIPVLKRESLPVELLKRPIEIDLTKVEGEYLQILIYDKDTTTENDYIGGVRFSINPNTLTANNGKMIAYKGEDGFFKLDYKFIVK